MSCMHLHSTMRKSVPFVVASLASFVAVSNHLGRAEASLSASNVVLQHNDAQMENDAFLARDAHVNTAGRQFRTSLTLVSLAAAALALAFVVYRCFRGLEGQRVVARRLADDEEWADGAECGDPPVGFYGGVPVALDEDRNPSRVLVEIKDGKPFLNHPKLPDPVALIVKPMAGVGLMFHEAGTGFDLEWSMFHPGEPHPSVLPKEGGEEEDEGAEEKEDSSSSDSEGEEDKPKTAKIVYQPSEEEWTHEENPEFPYVVTISGMPFQVDEETGELKRCLVDVQRGRMVFINPLFDQAMKLEFVDGELQTSEGLGLYGLVQALRDAGPPSE
ncbi:hypothetical protein, conserved [Eimeria brunetti]|uniref:Uncharacterized protein n=1 Tax=Eimeria brunetti TaxID=51314 RepID=U6LKN1_9EIME|nr:hypothetical protein, conserved [Eimeria brunetti]